MARDVMPGLYDDAARRRVGPTLVQRLARAARKMVDQDTVGPVCIVRVDFDSQGRRYAFVRRPQAPGGLPPCA